MMISRLRLPTSRILGLPVRQMLRNNSSASTESAKPLFRFQKSLPSLPVPTLKETCEKYLKTLVPLLTPEEYKRSEAAVAEFLRPGGPGEELQQRLLSRAAEKNKEGTSWLLDWWNDLAYMAYRDPVVIYVSYFYHFRDEAISINKPAKRAARLVKGAIAFRDMIVNESLQPDMMKSTPLCMHMFNYMFNTCRIPALPSDISVRHDYDKNKHIVVIRKNQFFIVELTDSNGSWLSTADIESQFERVIQIAGAQKALPIGVLTSENRDTWFEARKNLIAANSSNLSLLQRIESSMFAVCLDDSAPTDLVTTSRAAWHGDGRNRFFDKSLQFIVYENGSAGFNGEHSMMDGTPSTRLCDWILENLAKDKIDHGRPTPLTGLPIPQKLDFVVNESLTNSIKLAETNFDALVEKHDVNVVKFDGLGKENIKRYKLSPDAFAQMVIQLGYFRLRGRCDPTYESAQTKQFLHGRTETCRTVSVDSIQWVKSMDDPSLDSTKRIELLRKAIDSHVKYMNDAVAGKGVDRHLLGLRLLIKEGEEKPSLFSDPAYSRSCHWNLSTSQLTSEYFDGYGWGEVVPDGFGVAYMIKDQSIHFNVACLNNMNGKGLHDEIHRACFDMQALCERFVTSNKAKL